MSFDPAVFLADPDLDDFDQLSKDSLIVLGKHLGLSTKRAMRKGEIRVTIVKHLIEQTIFDKSALKCYESYPDLEIRRIELQNELEIRKLEIAQQEREKEKEQNLELEKQRMEHELHLKKMEMESRLRPTVVPSSAEKFDVAKQIRLVPPFQEKEVDQYFLHFEKIATNLKWPEETWTMLLQSVLVGKAREVYTQLAVDRASDYSYVKELILKAYELVPEAYRQKFRNCRKEAGQTFVEFARIKEQLFDRWCISKKIKDFDDLRQLVLIEEFKRCIGTGIRTFIDEQRVETLEDVARLSDDYALTHKSASASEHQYSEPRSTSHHVSHSNDRRVSEHKNLNPKSMPFVPTFKPPVCSYCKKEGHLISECRKLKKKKAQTDSVGLVTSQKNCVVGETNSSVSGTKDNPMEMDIFEPFVHDGFVSLSKDGSDVIPIKVLRDTGASQSLIIADVLPFSKETYTGTNVLIKGIDSSNYASVPLHKIYLTSKLVTGSVVVGLKSSLPFEGIHLLLGNDLAGQKVIVNPVLTEKPCHCQGVESIENEIIGLYPSCAVTRSMRKHQEDSDNNQHALQGTVPTESETTNEVVCRSTNLADSDKSCTERTSQHNEENEEINLEDTTLQELFEGDSSYCQEFNTCNDSVENDVSYNDGDYMATSSLVIEQHKDSDVCHLFERTVDVEEIDNNPVCYYTRNGILMRKWRPLTASKDQEWAVVHQIVVPTKYRSKILGIAHEHPLSGHLGVNKTYKKILHHFFWPGLRKDVSDYCRSCHTCQMVGKPNQVIPKAHLHPIPAIGEAFSRILIDCVGPLSKTKAGNQYLLTIMCVSTRFPEAVPLRKINAKNIVKALIKFFTFTGLPRAIQSDQGSNFMSNIFQQVMHELGIHQYRSSAYHPESQGAIERFHQTLKNMIRTFCFENQKDWDEGIPLLMFAARESVQESLGFSPFELVFGHSVRGPLKLLKEKFMVDDREDVNLLEYVTEIQERLVQVNEIAKKNLESSQRNMKRRYDNLSTERKFFPGEKVLALFPIPGRALQARYFGPYVIKEKVNDLNYILITPDRRKQHQLCHVNMLKPYHTRVDNVKANEVCPVTVGLVLDHPDGNEPYDGDDIPITVPKLTNSSILNNLDKKLSHLPLSHQQSLKEVLLRFTGLFPDVPTQTDQISHDIDVGNAGPIKQPPYRMNPTKKKFLNDEVQYLLTNNFIQPSKSSWCSPCVLVPKPDGTYRLCIDYRKVNRITKTDSFPVPRIDDCIDNIGKSQFVTKFDLLKGFWQVPLTDRAKEITAFVTPNGLYQYNVMPFGLKNGPATFQRLINSVTAGLEGCEAYMDDIILYSDSWEEHLERLELFFERLSNAKLTVNLSKSEFACGSVKYLGHTVGQGKVKPIGSKVQAIRDFPRPVTKKQVMRFLGMVGYYRKFCANFSTVSEPLTQLLRKSVKFEWTAERSEAFEKLKAILSSSPVLSTPDFSSPFKLAVDASDVAAGAVLLQQKQDQVDHPICFFSKKFNRAQRNYSTIEKECLSLILALQHFEVYVSTPNFPVLVMTDHNPLTFVHKLKNKNQRLMRWCLFLQEYNLEVQHIKGRDNVIADALSRVEVD